LERAGSIVGGIDSMTAETAPDCILGMIGIDSMTAETATDCIRRMIGTASTAPDSDAAVASAAAAAQTSSSDIILGFFFFSDCRDCRDCASSTSIVVSGVGILCEDSGSSSLLTTTCTSDAACNGGGASLGFGGGDCRACNEVGLICGLSLDACVLVL
jgi:hypothetical protein